MTVNQLKPLLTPGRRIHLVGIGGISMAPLGEVLHGMGLSVTGSDMKDGDTVAHLRELGIPVSIGHRAENVAGAELIVRTAAVHNDNPEIATALESGIPVFERAQAWGALMEDYARALCVSGTHGKTTTSSMCTYIMLAAGLDPTVMIGGTVPLLGAGHRVGNGDTIILESCEYCNSFLSFRPTTAVILDVDADHLDFFKDLDEIKSSFRAFAELVPDTGLVVANRDDVNTLDALKGLQKPLLTYGLQPGADMTAENLSFEQGRGSFDLIHKGAFVAHIQLSVPGRHNVSNALAAAAACLFNGATPQAVAQGLNDFHGAGRRFEYKGEYHGAKVYDDYAHHPQELAALLDAAQAVGCKRVICAFQPHTYTRTLALFSDFVTQLRRPDLVILTEIYAAREKNKSGISARDLAAQIPGAEFCPTLSGLAARLREVARPGDLILTVGAGDIGTVGKLVVGGD